MSGNSRREQAAGRHERTDSSWTDRSITSRLGTGYSNMESISPTSSHFMPAVFRARTRKLVKDGRVNKFASKKRMSSTRGRDRDSNAGRDSMAITALSDQPRNPDDSAEYLPSGQPKYGRLKDSSPTPGQKRRLPRKYSKQRLWNQMEFPRPMTSDRLSSLGVEPRLGPPTRSSQQGLPRWYAPSFVESLDTLIKSRC
ncbi:uncharacterized protein MYCGRDRAFT_105922, partial [Zymoseptoria tritici IPO323]